MGAVASEKRLLPGRWAKRALHAFERSGRAGSREKGDRDAPAKSLEDRNFAGRRAEVSGGNFAFEGPRHAHDRHDGGGPSPPRLQETGRGRSAARNARRRAGLLSYWNRERPLLDPFCGSGTIPIEAALIGRNIAPGLKRNFISETWNQIPFQDWVDVRLAAKEAILPDIPAPIFGCDLDPDAVEMARYHAQMAGVSNDVRFECRDFLKTESSDEYGCTIMNPPYGKWIGEYSELKALYFAIPSILQKLPTWSHYIYTAFPDFERLIGQEASRRRKIYNSRLECTYYQFFGPRPPKETEPSEENSQPSSQPIRGVFGGLSDSVKNSAKDFERRLEKLNHHLRRWPTKRGITCFRVYDRDIPEIPLAIDRYEDCLHIAEYDRPNDRNAAQQGQWMDLMVEITGRVLDVPKEKIFVKRRQRQRGASQYERWDTRHFVIEAHEGGLKFFVNLSDYLDTGLFLDHRITREMVRKEAAGKRFLILFAYAGSFSVYAAAGGAQSVTTVDLSNTYLDWAQDNMELNGFRGPQFEYVRSDVFRFLNALYDDEIFDLVVLDPPTFSNSKDLDDWDVQRDHAEMLNLLISHLAPGGVIYFSNNNRRFKLDEDAIQGVFIREISNRTVPEDFRNKRIHRCWRMVKKDE